MCSKETIESNIESDRILQQARNSLANYLARRDHSELELRQKLRRRYPETLIEKVIQEALERGWILPPEELAERVTQQLHRKKKGYLYIVRYLKVRGLPPAPADFETEIDKALELISSLFPDVANSFEQKQRAYRHLQRRGFEDSIIREVIRGDHSPSGPKARSRI